MTASAGGPVGSQILRAFYTDVFVLPLPDGHRFPMAKYAELRRRVAAELPDVELAVPAAARDARLSRTSPR